ncbi:exosortase A [Nitrosomonas aestuarii]|uniref:exosortase A n=1 Tax=Nitrosomonas aestuarii TaxID=52441 RepID=UPI000D315E84|nr:exosortase A [Nitrosomonas aestuarii]PTN11413.1 exosortase A [Nitrosomonas aestuarii]
MNTLSSTENLNRNPISLAALMTILAVAGIMIFYHMTAWSMVATWYRSETYAHGFLILPFVIYLIWTKRKSIVALDQQPSPTALIGLCVLGFLWLISELASVQVLAQYALVAMLPAVVAVIMGYRVMFAMAFPLVYLFFAVPFGDVLIPPLINFTADFTVNALQLSGIPVYREGTFFSLPTGNWSVVEACSGLRYLIASVTLGTLYAYLTYRSLSRRLIFIAFSIVVPILANGVRAYLIVMTGHLSDMQLAVGVDHLIYGWVFFGFVMLLLFWVGSLWREDSSEIINNDYSEKQLTKTRNNSVSNKKTILITCATLIITSIWPIYATYLEEDEDYVQQEFSFYLPDNKWHIASNSVSDWKPIYIGEPGRFEQHYVNNENEMISLYVTYYYNQRQGNELISSGNVLVLEMDSPWRKISEAKRSVMINSRDVTIRQTQLRSHSHNLLVWNWYVLGGDETINPYMAKALLARNRLLSSNDMGTEIIIAAPYEVQPDEAIPVLQQFLTDMLPAILNGLEDISEQ